MSNVVTLVGDLFSTNAVSDRKNQQQEPIVQCVLIYPQYIIITTRFSNLLKYRCQTGACFFTHSYAQLFP